MSNTNQAIRTLTTEKKTEFVDQILVLQAFPDNTRPDDGPEAVGRFENKLTLDALWACLWEQSQSPAACSAQLIDVLLQRWERIRGSNMCYTQQPSNPVNRLCLELAQAIAPPATTAVEIEALDPQTGPYFLLMPSLTVSEDVSFANIHELKLSQFVLSDDQQAYIPIVDCIKQASIDEDPRLHHMVLINGRSPLLTASEIDRVTQHSIEATQLYEAVVALNQQRLHGCDLTSHLRRLASALRKGGAHGGHGGEEYNSGAPANVGIVTFDSYWNGLSESRRNTILAQRPELRDALGRLFRPTDAEYGNARYCVELIADILDDAIEQHNPAQSLAQLIEAREQTFNLAIQGYHGITVRQNATPPNVFQAVFALNPDERRAMFSDEAYDYMVLYAVLNQPELLAQVQIDAEQKKQLVSAPVGPYQDPLLICAAKKGLTHSVDLILNWGADIASQDCLSHTALHWAAMKGHHDTATCLLQRNALLDAKGDAGNTPLHLAVLHGKAAIVDLLLHHHANLGIRNNQGKNALDLALEHHPELLESILVHVAKLSLDEQREHLDHFPRGPYDNVRQYMLLEQPGLFERLFMTDKNALKATNDALARMHFDEHFLEIQRQYQHMALKSLTNPNYIDAAATAKMLILTCMQAKFYLYQPTDLAFDDRLKDFKTTCESAIETARPVLSQHRQWGKVLAAFLLAVLTLPVSALLYATGFFSIKTQSEQQLDRLQTSICLGS